MTCALEFLAALVAIIVSLSYRLDNKVRDSKYGNPHPDATVDTTKLADKVCFVKMWEIWGYAECLDRRLPTSAMSLKITMFSALM